MASNHYITLFRSYRWNELFEEVKDTQLDSTIAIAKQEKLAIKAMMLVAWWADNITSREILKLFPPMHKDPFIHFCITYAYLCLGDIKMFKHYLSKLPKSTPIWMRVYLDIELYGRNLKFEKQISLVRKSTPKNSYPQDYIKVALLQSLEHDKADVKLLKEYVEDIDLSSDTDQLSIALCHRAGAVDILDVDCESLPLLLARRARKLISVNELIEALITSDKLAKTKFLDINTINSWLVLAISIPHGKEYMQHRVEFALSLVPHSLFIQGTIASFALIDSYRKGNYKLAYGLAQKFHQYRMLPSSEFIRNSQIFFNYILYLCSHWQHNNEIYSDDVGIEPLEVFGESHSLSLSKIKIDIDGTSVVGNTNFMMGVKMYHLKPNHDTFFSKALQLYFEQLQANSHLLFSIGEIDTRPSEGIWKNHVEKQKDLDTLIEDTVSGYIEFLVLNLKDKAPSSVTIQGIPAPGYEFKDKMDPGEDIDGFLMMVKKVNEKLKELTLQKGWNFLDIYSATVGEDKRGNKKWHIDGIHIQPLFYAEEANKWLIKPHNSF